MIELDTLAARLDARLAELYDQAAEWEHETRNPAYDRAAKAERELDTIRALQEEVRQKFGNGSSIGNAIGNNAMTVTTGWSRPDPTPPPPRPRRRNRPSVRRSAGGAA